MNARTRKILLFSTLALSSSLVLIDKIRDNPQKVDISEASNFTFNKNQLLDSNEPPVENILEIIPRTEEVISSNSFLAPPPPLISTPSPPTTPNQPEPPPLPFVYLGKQNINGIWSVFVSLQGNTKILKAGDSIEDNWIVDKIDSSSMNIIYVPLKHGIVVTIGKE